MTVPPVALVGAVPPVALVGAVPPVALVGATASGKSRIALEVAERCSRVELVSVDSMAVYRGMDIGTVKPDDDVRARVPYHLVDLVDCSEEFTVQQFQRAAGEALAAIGRRGRRGLMVGGTGLYLRSVVDGLVFPGRFPSVAARLAARMEEAGPEGSPEWRAAASDFHDRLAALDPIAAGRIGPTNLRRLLRALEVTVGSGRPFSSFGPGLERYPATRVAQIGLIVDREVLDRRIADRFVRLMEAGLLEEVRRLARRPEGLSRTARQALGYRELLAHIEDGLALDAAVDRAVQRTRALARRQLAWFRRDPRIVWVRPTDAAATILTALGAAERPSVLPG